VVIKKWNRDKNDARVARELYEKATELTEKISRLQKNMQQASPGESEVYTHRASVEMKRLEEVATEMHRLQRIREIRRENEVQSGNSGEGEIKTRLPDVAELKKISAILTKPDFANYRVREKETSREWLSSQLKTAEKETRSALSFFEAGKTQKANEAATKAAYAYDLAIEAIRRADQSSTTLAKKFAEYLHHEHAAPTLSRSSSMGRILAAQPEDLSDTGSSNTSNTNTPVNSETLSRQGTPDLPRVPPGEPNKSEKEELNSPAASRRPIRRPPPLPPGATQKTNPSQTPTERRPHPVTEVGAPLPPPPPPTPPAEFAKTPENGTIKPKNALLNSIQNHDHTKLKKGTIAPSHAALPKVGDDCTEEKLKEINARYEQGQTPIDPNSLAGNLSAVMSRKRVGVAGAHFDCINGKLVLAQEEDSSEDSWNE
ncbi:MAG: hypothetical protein HYX41_05265, partial [Bdellovibrio sp.]|nr:hypothetical protein [Bdellovibrio sp.]